MSKYSIRFILWGVVLFFGFILFNSWESDKNKIDKSNYLDSNKLLNEDELIDTKIDIKDFYVNSSNLISVDTNLVSVKINLYGGDIEYLELKKYSKSLHELNDGVVLFNTFEGNYYTPQIGILNNLGPDSKIFGRCLYYTDKNEYYIGENDSNLIVNLEYVTDNNIIINKIYTFKSYSYEVDIEYVIKNSSLESYSGRVYGLIKQKKDAISSGFFGNTNRSYIGAAVYTKEYPYKKISFEDIYNKKFNELVYGGWIAMLEHYFICSIIPFSNNNYIYNTEVTSDGVSMIRYVSENEFLVEPGDEISVVSKLFAGPKVKNLLNKLSKGLDLAIDYGMFWPIASPIFLLLSKIYSLVNNWGVAIILVTIIIKLLFFHLSSISYKSMGNMKKLQPKMEILKHRYKDDKKMFGQAVMDLYKKEKVNPLSGCLPVLIQIPVFISLYYVLLESVELRQAPFIFWIKDLSDNDPYYVLPIIMAFTMYLQQKLNPPIQDPTQAKIMMFMPVIFLFIFLQFPSGLILYWIVNNILSIIQQWFIMRKV